MAVEKVLRILDRRAVFNQHTMTLLLDGGKASLPIKIVNQVLYVLRTKIAERLLIDDGHSFLSGTLTEIGNRTLFVRDESHVYVQTNIDGKPNMNLSVKLPKDQPKELNDYSETLGLMLENYFITQGVKGFCVVPRYRPMGEFIGLDVVLYMTGRAQGVYFVHPTSGLMSFKIKFDDKSNSFGVYLLQQCKKITTTLNRQTSE